MKNSTLKKKLFIANTGLFLCFFLLIHLLGNLQLLLPEDVAREQFNWYSKMLSGNILIKIISWILYASIMGHAVLALLITIKNKTASGKNYYYDKRNYASAWNSRNMGILGTILLLFLIIHFKDFWYVYQFTELPLDSKGHKDLYAIVVHSYSQFWYVLIYEISLVALGFHLLHGFFSASGTLGLYHPKYIKAVKIIGWVYTLIITGGFMAIPLYIYFK
nr:succinate dehydrogenase cytochrome b subunit [uncultured Flavobacterium sp.]